MMSYDVFGFGLYLHLVWLDVYDGLRVSLGSVRLGGRPNGCVLGVIRRVTSLLRSIYAVE